ncbi:putative U-box domain-containing protein 55 [Phaseolus vulgaris]|uniref:putative U-box domain-containing protein 55 n=1 Tax=Phaseolus vulgaris TaxID=3885 RepID=UPI0035CBE592
MLGKDHMARLRSVVKRHKLAAGSQTVPNSVAEAAIARAELPPVGSSSPIAPPAPSRKKLPPKRAKRKNPIMVSDEEDDESTEDGLVRKRNRATVAELPANEIAGGVPEQTTDIQRSSQPVVEPDASPPRPDVPLVVHTYEGSDENQPPPPLPIPALPAPIEEVLKAHVAYLSAMTTECVEKRLHQMMGEALRDSLGQYKSEAGVAKDQVQQLKRDLTMRGLEFSRLENALKEELRSERKNSAELDQKLSAKLLEVTELEGKLVHQQEKIAGLGETLKAKGAYADELEAKSIEREDLLGKIKADMDQKAKELSEKEKELSESTTKLAQALEENEKLKKQSEELDLNAANVLTFGFSAALEQFACAYPDLDLSQFSICHEVVDGKIVPSD